MSRPDTIATIITAAALAALILPDVTNPAHVIPLVVAILVVSRVIALGIAWAAGWVGRKPFKSLENS
jgi:hypothetical protein